MSTTAACKAIDESGQLSGQNKLMQGLLIAAIVASGLSMIFSIGTAFVSASQDSSVSIASVEPTLD